MGANYSEVRRYEHRKRVFSTLDVSRTGKITYYDMLRVDLDAKSDTEKYFSYLLQVEFQSGKNPTNFITFEQFLDLCDKIEAKARCTCCRQKQYQSQSRSVSDAARLSNHSFCSVNQYMHPADDSEISDFRTVVEHVLDTAEGLDRRSQLDLTEAFGLKRPSGDLHMVFRPQHYNQKLNPKETTDYLTEAELCVLIDQAAAKGINIASILSTSTIRANPDLVSHLNDPNTKDQVLAKLLVKEFDVTNSGCLNKLEHKNLLRAIQTELDAHKHFVGAHLKNVGRYVTGRTMGFGATSICKCAIQVDNLQGQLSDIQVSQQQVALKIQMLQEQTDGAKALDLFKGQYCVSISEIEALQECKHDNIVDLKDHFVFVDPEKRRWQVLALTLCGGGRLSDYRAATNLNEPIVRFFFIQIIGALKRIHDRSIAHMDLRLENILLDNDGNVRICDFGNALSFKGLDHDMVKAGTIAGHLSHMPPEMVAFEQDFSATKADMWSCGLILYELLTGKSAFPVKKNDNSVVSKIIKCQFEPLGLGFSPEARDLCNELLNYDPTERPTCIQVLKHPWLQKDIHKPAMAKGIVLLDPAPHKVLLDRKIQECLAQESVVIISSEYEQLNEPNAIFKLKCLHNCSGMQFVIFGEMVDGNVEQMEIMDLEYQSKQLPTGNAQLENIIFSHFKTGASAVKLTFYLKHGILQEFQKLFRRIRFLIMSSFDPTDQTQKNHRHDANPCVESVMTRAVSQLYFDPDLMDDSTIVPKAYIIADEGGMKEGSL